MRMEKLQSHPAWWNLKKAWFHSVMIPLYISSLVWNMGKRTLLPTFITIMTPLLPLVKVIAYISGLILGISGELSEELIKMLLRLRYYKTEKKKAWEPNVLQLGTYHHFTPPLPYRYMILSGVQLSNAFVGWITKMVGRPKTFMEKMHGFGLHKLLLVTLLWSGCIINTTAMVERIGYRVTKGMQVVTKLRSTCNASTSHICSLEGPETSTFSSLKTQTIRNPSILQQELYTRTPLCLPCEALYYMNPTVLANEQESANDEDMILDFESEGVEFGADNCATHHICADRSLFVGEVNSVSEVGVKGINGVTQAEGIGRVKFRILDDDDNLHDVTLDNVLYLPGAAKNLISISKWSEDKRDNCGIMTRGDYSLFMWSNDQHTKSIFHDASCRIPLMKVIKPNQIAIGAMAYFQNCTNVIDDGPLVHNGLPPRAQHQLNQEVDLEGKPEVNADQQPAGNSSFSDEDDIIEKGTTVRTNIDGIQRVSIITGIIKAETGHTSYQVRHINGETEQIAALGQVRRIRMEPADIPLQSDDVDTKLLQEELTKEDLKRLWNGTIDDTVPEADRIALYWHHRLRHAPLVSLRRLAIRGLLPACIKKVMKMPLCAACAFASAHRKNWRTKKVPKTGIRKLTDVRPGDGTSTDHLVSRQPGLMPQTSGILTHGRFWGAAIFVDHATDFIYAHLLRGISSQETLDAKCGYERTANAHGVTVGGYHADNLRFNDNKFTGDCVSKGQKLTFCGVGAHHQNGVVERKNKELTNGARTVLLHAQRKWPKVIKPLLWPYALLSVVERHNRLSLDKDGKSPMEKFSSTHEDIHPTDFHTWGCPVFVLDAENQSGKIGTPKWDPKSHAGIYLGHSPCHAGSVALVLNLATGLISPQFHVIFDDEFTTVGYLETDQTPPNWVALAKHAVENSTPPEEDLAYSWLHPSNIKPTNSENESLNKIQKNSNKNPPSPQQINPPNSQNFREGEKNKNPRTFVNLETLGLRRSPRIAENPRKINYGLMVLALSSFVKSVPEKLGNCYQSRQIAYMDFLDTNFDGTQNQMSPLAQIYTTTKINNEVFTLKEMLEQPDRDEFVKAMQEEVESIFKEKIWKRVPRDLMEKYYEEEHQKGIYVKRKQLMMIWSFKRKRKPDGTLDKYKARLCCHGGQQEWGITYWDTYAPVVSWSSVRILMTLANLHKLHTRAVDFIQAYPQAKIKAVIFLKTPPGVTLETEGGREMVLLLLKNLYGLKDAGLTWYEHLTAGLTKIGFEPTKSDPCVYVRNTNIIIMYVDDCVIISKSEGEANAIMEEIKNQGLKLTDEGTMETYLGIQIKREENGDFTLSQPYLIDRIIGAIRGMEDAKMCKSPASSTVTLTKDLEGEKRKEQWNYRSVIGMLNYLVNSTQPDLAYAVHQCARFSNDPKRSHEQAVKRILRYLQYLKKTDTIGVRFSPQLTKSLEVYVDASFAGDWNSVWNEEPTSVMSRTGYLIKYGNCPIIWCSKLQSEIALSTTESEYIALSQSLRDAIPLMELLKELRMVIDKSDDLPEIHCSIFEDNLGCVDLVKTPRMRPRTKHIALKYHHFREHVRKKLLTIHYIETKEQVADIFTKALPDPQFLYLRKMLTGF